MDKVYNNRAQHLGYAELVCDIFPKWESVKDEILIPERKQGSGNGTIHVFLGAADQELRKEFDAYYTAVENGEDPSDGAVQVTHYFLRSNLISLIGYLCQYCYSKGEPIDDNILPVLRYLQNTNDEGGFVSTTSLFKLSTGASKLRPYFKQFDSNGIFTKLIRQILLPESSYKISLYKNEEGEYAAFWLIGFSWQSNFEANSTKEYFEKDEEYKKISDSLQQIFYGAPGTGKSHTINLLTKNESVIRATFHPDSDYSTFVGAYKPTSVEVPVMIPLGDKVIYAKDTDGKPATENRIVYEFVPQAFLQAYVKAWEMYAKAQKNGEETKRQYLVIEEINRGNCAQIFGDLFQLLDRRGDGFSEYPINADKDLQKQLAKLFADLPIMTTPAVGNLSAEEVATRVRNGEILVLPSNLYIWATMNTSDQSLFPIDSAFKRRWDWKYVPINEDKESWQIEAEGERYNWSSFLHIINQKIQEATSSEDKMLGFYFCKAKNGTVDAETFVGKVVFYLWNDVFKDNAMDDTVFDDEDGGKLEFRDFYDKVTGKVVERKVTLFLDNLKVEKLTTGNEAETATQEENDENPD